MGRIYHLTQLAELGRAVYIYNGKKHHLKFTLTGRINQSRESCEAISSLKFLQWLNYYYAIMLHCRAKYFTAGCLMAGNGCR